jgi:hypothetical protein
LLNLDGVHGTDCPVAFWYHHPSIVPEVGAEFIQMPDKSLYCRSVSDGAYSPVHDVREGSSVDLGMEYSGNHPTLPS